MDGIYKSQVHVGRITAQLRNLTGTLHSSWHSRFDEYYSNNLKVIGCLFKTATSLRNYDEEKENSKISSS